MFDESDASTMHSDSESETESLSTELEDYLRQKTEKTKDPILWWIERRSMFPRLSRMGIDYLSIPGTLYHYLCLSSLLTCYSSISATSVEVERVFSKGRLLLSHLRNRLSASSTRASLCLGSWSRMGLVRDSDILGETVKEESKLVI